MEIVEQPQPEDAIRPSEKFLKRSILEHTKAPGEEGEGSFTNNDGSVNETLDTAFHGTPGMIKDHSLAGSNRADYYEGASSGESDSDEETDYLKKQNKHD